MSFRGWGGLVTVIWTVALPLISILAPHPWLPLSLAVPLFLCLVIAPLRPGYLFAGFQKSDALLVGMVGLGLIGWMWAPEFGSRARNHGLAITVCVIVFFFMQRDVLLRTVGFDRLCRGLSISLLLASGFILTEFYLANFTGYQMRDLIPYLEIRLAPGQIEESIMMQRWIRPRGYAFEAGHMATFFEFALPLSFVYMSTRRMLTRTLFYGLCGTAFLLLASAAGIFALLVASTIIFFRSGVPGRTKWLIFIGCGVIATGMMFSEPARDYAWNLVFGKVTGFVGLGGTDGYSSQDRSGRALAAVNIVQRFPVGIGWGTAAYLSMEGGGLNDIPFGFISFYAEVLVAGGWAALLLWLLFVAIKIVQAWRQRDVRMTTVLVAVVSLSIHYMTISNFWFPSFWLSYAVVDHLIRQAQSAGPAHPMARTDWKCS